ncbi:MAG TPA: acyl-ACP--UDP-N-acetylglucosamine O-acyltransferase [Syntrophorhabdaceae bacterium]|nr:acyl-ACP--UDP-N-acetylglucosamine O-acyltransferase [Syntrophorhabdaceae bacterium]
MIHPTAVVDSKAQIDETAEIGAYCTIDGPVSISKGTRLISHVVVQGRTTIGENCTISPFASIGGAPQDITYKGEDTQVIIGKNTRIMEYVTINRGTEHGGGITRVGDRDFIMAYAHVAHDCTLGDNVIMTNGATLGGHVEVADFATIAALCAIHQFCRIGKYAFVSGMTGVPNDVPPFVMAAASTGIRAKLYGLNVVGLQRNGFTKEDISKLKKAYKILFRSALPLNTSLKIIQEEIQSEHIQTLIDFIKSSKRGICR